MNDVVVLLPGIMGSALAKGDEAVWDVSGGALGRALRTLGGSLRELTLESDASTGAGVAATHVLRDAHMLPGLWKVDGYSELSEFIQEKFEVSPGENFFEFAYDWRLDNRISARRLETAARDWLANWTSPAPGTQPRLILIAHSMGGLVARYFLECLGGWEYTKTLITLGTPFRGSVKALDFLVNGVRKKLGPLTLLELTDMVRSFPSVHQLLPIYPCVGETEQTLERLTDIRELGELDMERVGAGIEFHREIERQVAENAKNSQYAASACRLMPVVGTYQPTYQSALLSRDVLRPIETYRGQTMLGGDGTVPRLSATPIELSNAKAETFVACPHASLQNFDPVRVQVRAALEDIDISEIKASPVEAISLRMDDVFGEAERVRASARCDVTLDPIHAVLSHVETGNQTECEFDVPSDGEWQTLDLEPMAAGTYKILVEAGDEAEPITDIFVVL
jgi:hypothetical protein